MAHELGSLPRLAREMAGSADAVILAHPYLFPLVRELEVPFLVYDAHDAEWALKQSMYAKTAVGIAAAGQRRTLSEHSYVNRTSELIRLFTNTIAART